MKGNSECAEVRCTQCGVNLVSRSPSSCPNPDCPSYYKNLLPGQEPLPFEDCPVCGEEMIGEAFSECINILCQTKDRY